MQMKALQNFSKTSKQIKSDMSDFSIINSRDKYILNHLNVLVLSQLSMYIYISCSSQIGFDIKTIDQKKVTQIETCDRVQYFLMLLINYILIYVLNKIEVFFFKQNGYFLQCRHLQTFLLFICLTMGFTKVVRILLMSVGNISKYISTAFMCRR